MNKPGSDEVLRQNVFSSIHMSTEVKTGQVSISYPSCSFCGGGLGARKVVTCYVSLYTNSSESFVVWCKKPDEPKGMLWLRSCCVRRGAQCSAETTMPIELISKGCRGRCSYTLRFSKRALGEEWYRSLRQETRKHTAASSTLDVTDDPFSSDSGEEGYSDPLDSILSDHDNSTEDRLKLPQTKRKISSPTFPTKHKDFVDTSLKKKSKGRHGFQLPFTAAIMDRSNKSIYTTSSQDTPSGGGSDTLGRWSWPVKV